MALCSSMLPLLLMFSISFGFSTCLHFDEEGFNGVARPQRSLANTALLCGIVNCVKGVCQDSSLFPYYQCQCNQGWSSPLNTSWIPCVVPNCSLDLNCNGSGNKSSSASPPAAAPVGGVFDICALPVCGNGDCVTSSNSSLSYECKCNPGSTNFLNTSSGYCVEPCSLGAGCSSLNVTLGGSPSSSPPPPPNPSQGTSSSPSSSNQTIPSRGTRPTYMAELSISIGILLLHMGWLFET